MTTQPTALPLSGYSIVRVVMTTAELKIREPEGENEQGKTDVNFGWDWRRAEKSLFDVRLTLSIDPSPGRPYYAAVDAIGRFRQVGDTPSLSVEDFASLQAVAILLPYVRQHLTALTANTPSGPYYLPSVNVVELMKDMNGRKATGAKQSESALGRESEAVTSTATRKRRSSKKR